MRAYIKIIKCFTSHGRTEQKTVMMTYSMRGRRAEDRETNRSERQAD